MEVIYLDFILCELAYKTHEEHLFKREWYVSIDSIKYVEIENRKINFVFKDGEIETFDMDDIRGNNSKYLINYAEVLEIIKLHRLKVKM
ncbi:hypothetical protein [Fusobacterium sp. CM1]|uniref:hypothetical protein n=1 Tax=Fusobacterium TaxID=848 RepID=UPI000450BC06|nr:hypothetical protein [Fusobacterium sp. CM1]EUB35048.1 hypothetical protein HMPREF1498_0326 [Fusobacterium sp. CM1]